MFKNIVAGICIVVGILVLMWVFMGNNFFLYKVFAPMFEQTRREVFENTKSYQQGMVQDLSRIREEYIQAQPDNKPMLAQVYLFRLSDFDRSKLPPQLRLFTSQLERGGE